MGLNSGKYKLYFRRKGWVLQALSLLDHKMKEPFFVMNGDLLANINFEHLHDFHLSNNSVGTMCARL